MVYATNSAGYQAIPTEQPLAEELYADVSPIDAGLAARAKSAALRAYADAAAKSFAGRGELSSDLEAINQLEDFNYSPAALEYLQNYQNALTGYAGPYSLSSMDLNKSGPQTGAAMPYTSGYLEQAAARGDPMDRMYASFDPETGTSATRSSNTIQFDPNAEYRVIDRSTGKVLHTGTGYEAGAKIAELTKGIYGEKGGQADWDVQRNDGGSWSSVRDQDPETSGFGTFLKMALPILTGGTLAPLMGGGALGAGLATAAGSAGAGALMGDSLGDILKSAALSGVTAGALQGIMPAGPSGTPVNTAHTGIANAIGGGANNAITVLGNLASRAAPSVAGGITNALASTGSNPVNNPPAGALESAFDGILVKGTPSANFAAPPGSLVPGFPSTLQGALSAAQPGPVNYADQMPVDEIVAKAPRKPDTGLSDLGKAVAAGAAATGLGVAAGTSGGATSGAGGEAASAAGGGGLGLGFSDYLQLAGLGLSALGGGGGGSGSAGKIPGGAFGSLNPLFSKTLPQANLPGAGDLTPRTMPVQDWNTYAMRPEQSFFNYVPQNPQGFADGGGVEGPGTGRSDSIPAVLSDGEYVIDAETVALLGDGSPKAGADRLDNFRVNIRKHKGRDLSRGKISPDAKRPEQYFSGGLA